MMALNRYRLRHLVQEGHRGARLAASLLAQTDRLLGVILLGNNLINAMSAALVTIIAVRFFGGSDLALVWLNYATFLFFALGIALMARLGSSVPTSFVMPGFLLGFFFAGLGPWPWPASWTPQALAQTPGHFAIAPQGMQLAPLWNPPPAWLIPDQPCFGLATAATGALMIGLGMMMADLVSRALRRRRAFHPQDILVGTLVGAYLGWQAGLVASLMAVFFWGVTRLMGRLDQPFLFWLASCSIGVLLLWSFVLVLGQQLGQ